MRNEKEEEWDWSGSLNSEVIFTRPSPHPEYSRNFRPGIEQNLPLYLVQDQFHISFKWERVHSQLGADCSLICSYICPDDEVFRGQDSNRKLGPDQAGLRSLGIFGSWW